MKLARLAQNSGQKLRFGTVGVINTLIDFSLYSVLTYVAGLPLILANLVSTSAGFMASFFLNRRFTFDSHNERKLHEFIRFLATTLVGLWLLQPATILYGRALLELIHFSGIWLVVLPKGAAILVGLVWNYVWYSRYVFVSKRPDWQLVAVKVKRYLVTGARSDFGVALGITLLWQLVMTFIGVLIQYAFVPHFVHPGSINLSAFTPLFHTGIWDGGWFQQIANNLYHGNPAEPAFYPLFPFSARLVRLLFLNHISLLGAGLLFNTLCLWFGLTALLKTAKLLYANHLESVGWTIALFLSFPAAFFLHQFYSEAVFVAFGFWAYYFALIRHWRAAAICLGILTGARITAVLFIVLVGLEFWRSHAWSLKKTLRNPQVLWFALAPVGFLAYGLYLKLARGDFLAMFHAYRATNDWVYQKFNPNIAHLLGHGAKVTVQCTLSHFHGCNLTDDLVNFILPFILLMIMVGLSIIAIIWLRGIYLPLGLMGLATFVMLTLNNNLVSVHRYLLPVLPIYFITVELMRRLRWPLWLLFPLIQIGLLLQTLLYLLFINVYFAG